MSDKARRRWLLLLVTLSGALWFGAGTEAAHGLLDGERWDWVAMVLLGLPWALALVAVQWGVRTLAPRPGERRARAELEQLRATGTLPPEADPAQLRPFLEEQCRRLVLSRRLVVGLSLALAALVGAAAVVANDNSPAVWGLAVVVVLDSIAVHRLGRVRTAATEQLLGALPA